MVINEDIEWPSKLRVSFDAGRDERVGGHLTHSLSNFELIGDYKCGNIIDGSRRLEYSQNPM